MKYLNKHINMSSDIPQCIISAEEVCGIYI